MFVMLWCCYCWSCIRFIFFYCSCLLGLLFIVYCVTYVLFCFWLMYLCLLCTYVCDVFMLVMYFCFWWNICHQKGFLSMYVFDCFMKLCMYGVCFSCLAEQSVLYLFFCLFSWVFILFALFVLLVLLPFLRNVCICIMDTPVFLHCL